MEANEKISLFNEVTAEESATVSGGDSVNFDLDSYLFRIGAGALFDGGLTSNVVNLAFQGAIYTSSGGGTTTTTSTTPTTTTFSPGALSAL